MLHQVQLSDDFYIDPTLFYQVIPESTESNYWYCSTSTPIHHRALIQIIVLIGIWARPKALTGPTDPSRRLASPTNASLTPIVRFNYFNDTRDLSQCVNAMRAISKMLRTPVMEQDKSMDQHSQRYF
ncbi:hypothetical protein LguiA_002865 [Lonicera macranthoides]